MFEYLLSQVGSGHEPCPMHGNGMRTSWQSTVWQRIDAIPGRTLLDISMFK